MLRPLIMLILVLATLGCNEASYTSDSKASEGAGKSTTAKTGKGSSDNPNNDRKNHRPDNDDEIAPGDEASGSIGAGSTSTVTHQADNNAANISFDTDLLGTWKLTEVACPSGTLAGNALAENMLLADGSEQTHVEIRHENDTASKLEVSLKIPNYGISCAMKQEFILTSKSAEIVAINTTSDVENSCPEHVNNLHIIEGNNYSTPLTYEVQADTVTLRGRFPIRVSGPACDTGELAYVFKKQD